MDSLPEQRELMSESDVLKFNSIEARLITNEKIQVKENSKYGIWVLVGHIQVTEEV